MHIGNRFNVISYVLYMRHELAYLFWISFIPAVIYYYFHWTFMVEFPMLVSTMLGSSTAFVIAFKNNWAMTRFTDAYNLYTEIASISNNLGLQLLTCNTHLANNRLKTSQIKILNLHFAYLTALRYALRIEKIWENLHDASNHDFMVRYYVISERTIPIETELAKYVSKSVINTFISSNKSPLYFLELQIGLIQDLLSQHIIDDRTSNIFISLITQLNKSQVNCLRIKNVPYPRNFYSITIYFTWLFILVLPFSLLSELHESLSPWVIIPIVILIGGIFLCLEKVGHDLINPFEGGVHDVPITSISRHIEIELKTMFDFELIPEEIEGMSGYILL